MHERKIIQFPTPFCDLSPVWKIKAVLGLLHEPSDKRLLFDIAGFKKVKSEDLDEINRMLHGGDISIIRSESGRELFILSDIIRRKVFREVNIYTVRAAAIKNTEVNIWLG